MASDRLTGSVRLRLSIMMLLQYAFQGIWIIPLGAYLSKVGFTGTEIGSTYGMVAIGFICAPFVVGLIADRFFAAQKILGVLNIAAALLLVVASQIAVGADGTPRTVLFQVIILLHCLCYTPSWALTNTIALNQMSNPGKQFPAVRVMGTIGWIIVATMSLFSAQISAKMGYAEGTNIEMTNLPLIVGGVIGMLAGVLSFFLPNTPPKSLGHKVTVSDILGLNALALFKDRNFLVFSLSSFLIMFAGLFYWNFCNLYLNEIGMPAAMFMQSIGQMAELIFLVIMPWFFIRFGVKKMLFIGFLAWIARFVLFANGNIHGAYFVIIGGLALHGVCFDFFFVTGQLYTDKKAPKAVQAAAQGLTSLITFGLGWLVGSNLAGYVLDQTKTFEFDRNDVINVQNYEKTTDDGTITAKGFLAQLKADAATEGSVASRIMAKLDKDAIAVVDLSSDGTKPTGEQMDTLMAGFNTVITDKDFFQAADFNLEEARNEIKEMLAKDRTKLEVAEVQELNRMAIENSYSDDIAKRRHNWKTFFYVPAGIAFAVMIFFLLFFNDNIIVGEDDRKKGEAVTEE